MQYKFHAFGHPNILATHKTTLEFTKDNEVSLNGDCIIGVRADFDLRKIKEFVKKSSNKKIAITIEALIKGKRIKETVIVEINSKFDSDGELVIRKSDFASERTFGIRANKAAFELNTDLIEFLKGKGNKISILFKTKEE